MKTIENIVLALVTLNGIIDAVGGTNVLGPCSPVDAYDPITDTLK